MTHVYILIHDKEPQDSGSDYRLSQMTPARQDTEIIGVFSSYNKAERAAENYVRRKFSVSWDELDEICWDDEGWYRMAESSWEGDDRVYIEDHEVE